MSRHLVNIFDKNVISCNIIVERSDFTINVSKSLLIYILNNNTN